MQSNVIFVEENDDEIDAGLRLNTQGFCRRTRDCRMRGTWLGRQDSNLGMAESKSKWFALLISAHSEKMRKFDLNPFKRLGDISECPDRGPRISVRGPRPSCRSGVDSAPARQPARGLLGCREQVVAGARLKRSRHVSLSIVYLLRYGIGSPHRSTKPWRGDCPCISGGNAGRTARTDHRGDRRFRKSANPKPGAC